MDDLSAMCETEYPRLVGMLSLYCGDRDTAEDLAQEALIRLCRDWKRVRRYHAPQRWLNRVAVNLAHSHYRRRTIERRVLGVVGRRPTVEIHPNADIETLELLKNFLIGRRARCYFTTTSICRCARSHK